MMVNSIYFEILNLNGTVVIHLLKLERAESLLPNLLLNIILRECVKEYRRITSLYLCPDPAQTCLCYA